ncbi:ATP-binding protein [Streptomyces fradiae]|uniref:ATP-binding protein n=1 Tax=Streptomyces fradiae TaxID=1906 RepID=UPI00351237D8
MSPTLRTAICPVSPHAAEAGVRFTYSLTVPGTCSSAAVVRTAVRSALHAHRLRRYTFPAQLAASELVSTAARLAPGEDAYFSLGCRPDSLRLVLWDQHPRHEEPDAETVCAARRRRALWLLDVAVEDWGGEWGITEAQPPHRGTKSWVVLPW